MRNFPDFRVSSSKTDKVSKNKEIRFLRVICSSPAHRLLETFASQLRLTRQRGRYGSRDAGRRWRYANRDEHRKQGLRKAGSRVSYRLSKPRMRGNFYFAHHPRKRQLVDRANAFSRLPSSS